MTAPYDTYPLFIPPEPLSTKPIREWTRSEARRYAEWQRTIIPSRISQLVQFFGDSEGTSPQELLLPLGNKVAAVLHDEAFSSGQKLTNRGYALGADMGLLLSCAFRRVAPEISWDIVFKPKSDAAYNQPVLVGFPHGMPVDPVASSIAMCYGILRGTKDGTIWHSMYVWLVEEKGSKA